MKSKCCYIMLAIIANAATGEAGRSHIAKKTKEEMKMKIHSRKDIKNQSEGARQGIAMDDGDTLMMGGDDDVIDGDMGLPMGDDDDDGADDGDISQSCFHESSEFLGPNGNPVAVSSLKVGDPIMVVQESNVADDPAVVFGVPVEAKIVGWKRRPAKDLAPSVVDTCNLDMQDFVEINYEFAGGGAGEVIVTAGHYIRTADDALILAKEVEKEQYIRVWSPTANSGQGEFVEGTVTEVRTFEDSGMAVYSPLTDKGTNFVTASGAILPMDGQLMIDGFEVHHDYIVKYHHLFATVKSFASAPFWDTICEPALAPASSILDGPCVETVGSFNNLVTALRANDNEGLLLLSDPDNFADVLEWGAENIFEIVGAQNTGTWMLRTAATAVASLALKADELAMFITTRGVETAVKINVNRPAPSVVSLTANGQQCAAGRAIADESECKGAAMAKNAKWKGKKPSRNRQYGCYYIERANEVFYNPTPATKRLVWNKSKGMCKGGASVPFLTYKVGKAKGRNCADGEFVSTVVDCQSAANELGKSYKKSVTSKKRPAGCYFRGNKVWLNTRTAVYQKGRYGKFTGVCKVLA